MSIWLSIVKTAVIGVERQKLPEFKLSDQLGGILARIDAGDREGALLSAAAAAALYERAGRLPRKDRGDLPAPCSEADLPGVSPQAAARLSLILSGQHTFVLDEWLRAAARRGVRAADESLPALLEFGRLRKELREAIQNVLGERGRWLARQNPDWDYIGQPADESIWETGSQAQRLDFFSRLRAKDSARARELAGATWSQEAAHERADLIKLFARGLSPGDESFLEAALEDKRKEVRRAAAELLANLSSSALVQRMFDRVSPLLEFKERPLGRDLIEVEAPSECDRSMQRDGVEPKPPHAQIGERAWRLQQMLSAIPPERWSARWRRSPAEMVKAAGRSEQREVLLDGWARAAARHHDDAWLEALLDHKLREPEQAGVAELFQALSPEIQDAYCLKIARRNFSLNPDQPLHWLLNCYAKQWNENLSRMVLQSLAKHCAEKDFIHLWTWGGFLVTCGRYLDIQLAGEATIAVSKLDQVFTEIVPLFERFLEILQFRAEMLREIDQ